MVLQPEVVALDVVMVGQWWAEFVWLPRPDIVLVQVTPLESGRHGRYAVVGVILSPVGGSPVLQRMDSAPAALEAGVEAQLTTAAVDAYQAYQAEMRKRSLSHT